MKMLKLKTLTIALTGAAIILAARPAQASFTFDYSYTFGNGLVASGSLTGDLIGDMVNNISDVTLFFNGTQVPGTIYTATYNPLGNNVTGNAYWASGAVVSTDVTKNDFIFTTGDVANNLATIYDQGFYIVPNGQQQAFAHNNTDEGFDYPPTAPQWSLTQRGAAAVVPEPTTFIAGVLLFVPFAVQSVRHLRKQKQVS